MRNILSGDKQTDNFNDLLNKFDKATSKKGWEELIAEAKQREPITSRQREAVIVRCQSQINGTYGSKTYTPSNYDLSRNK